MKLPNWRGVRCALGLLGVPLALVVGGCAPTREARSADDAPEPTGAEQIQASGKVALRAFELGGRVAWQGLQAVGSATTGLVTDGKAGAARRWESGSEATKRVARQQAARVRSAAADERLTGPRFAEP